MTHDFSSKPKNQGIDKKISILEKSIDTYRYFPVLISIDKYRYFSHHYFEGKQDACLTFFLDDTWLYPSLAFVQFLAGHPVYARKV